MIGICGASGYIGWELYKYLRFEKNEEVMGTYCSNTKKCLKRFDLRQDPVDCFDDCDFVVILSAYAKIAFCEENKFEAHWLNVYKTNELLLHLTEKGIPAIFISSDAAEKYDAVYGKYKREVEKFIDKNNLIAMYLRPGKINDDNMLQLLEVIYANIKSRCGEKVKA